MHESQPMLFSFTVFPVGDAPDVAGPVADAVALIEESGLDYQVTGSSTLVEGTWDRVMPVLEECIHRLTEEHDRVYADVTVDYHRGEEGRIRGSVEEVEETLGLSVPKGGAG